MKINAVAIGFDSLSGRNACSVLVRWFNSTVAIVVYFLLANRFNVLQRFGYEAYEGRV